MDIVVETGKSSFIGMLFSVCFLLAEVKITKDTQMTDDKVIDSNTDVSKGTRRKCSDDTSRSSS